MHLGILLRILRVGRWGVMKNIRAEAHSDSDLGILVPILREPGRSSGGGGRPFFILSSQRFMCPRYATVSPNRHTVAGIPHITAVVGKAGCVLQTYNSKTFKKFDTLFAWQGAMRPAPVAPRYGPYRVLVAGDAMSPNGACRAGVTTQTDKVKCYDYSIRQCWRAQFNQG